MKIIKIILPILIIIAVAGGLYYYSTILEEEKIAEEKVKQQQILVEKQQAEELAEQKKLHCTETDKFFLIAKDHEDNVGQDILIKTKDSTVTNTCKYEVAANDFEIKGVDPEYYKALQENALVTDVGTGPSGRSFRLYDMVDKKLVVEKKYFDEMTVEGGLLTYFGLSKTKADKKNCKDFANFTKDGLTPNLVVKKTIDLKTYSVKEGKETKCVASQ